MLDTKYIGNNVIQKNCELLMKMAVAATTTSGAAEIENHGRIGRSEHPCIRRLDDAS
jgi:hypothetical protein